MENFHSPCTEESSETAEMQSVNAQNDNLMTQIILEQFRQFETDQKNHTYSDEMRIIEAIYRGDPLFMRENFNRIIPRYPAVLKDEKQNAEYMAVFSVAYGARAAAVAGVPFSESIIYSDHYLQVISKCTTAQEIRNTVREAYIAFTELVHSYHVKEAPNPYVVRCQHYIRDHITEKVMLDQLAKVVGLTPAHLSRVFSHEMHMTLTQYYLQQKISVARDILSLTDQGIEEISDYLGFSSCSYFCKAFRKIANVTPMEYRRRNHQVILKQR